MKTQNKKPTTEEVKDFKSVAELEQILTPQQKRDMFNFVSGMLAATYSQKEEITA